METQKTPNSQSNLEKEKRSWRNQDPWEFDRSGVKHELLIVYFSYLILNRIFNTILFISNLIQYFLIKV